jgi:steroid delta-isomerase-like uncharacterized protein
MSAPHPSGPGYAKAYSHAWTSDLDGLLEFFAADGIYTDVAMGTTYEGHPGIGKFHRFMLKFAPDSVIDFSGTYAVDGHLTSKWVWSGTFSGPLRLRSGKLVNATGARFSVPGVAVCTYDEHGKLTSHEDYWDLASVLEQASVPIG